MTCLNVYSQKSVNLRGKKTLNQQQNLSRKIYFYAKKYSINPRLFYALIYAESGFKTKALSYKGAYCLTQLMPATARRLGLIVSKKRRIDERKNVDKCLDAGARYLRMQLNEFKDFRIALAGYNAGEGAVREYSRRKGYYCVPPYKETIQYVEKISATFLRKKGLAYEVACKKTHAIYWINRLYKTFRPPRFVSSPIKSKKLPARNSSGRDKESSSIGLATLTEKKAENNAENKSSQKKAKPTLKRISKEKILPSTQSITFW